MNSKQMYALLAETHDRMKQLSMSKGEEYTGGGDKNRLQNFLSAGERLGLDPTVVLFIAMDKHFQSIATYVKERQAGKVRDLAEPIESRIDDFILYGILLKGLIREMDGKREWTVESEVAPYCEEEGCPHYGYPHGHAEIGGVKVTSIDLDEAEAVAFRPLYIDREGRITTDPAVPPTGANPPMVNNWHTRLNAGAILVKDQTDARLNGVYFRPDLHKIPEEEYLRTMGFPDTAQHYADVIHDTPTAGIICDFIRGESVVEGPSLPTTRSLTAKQVEYNGFLPGPEDIAPNHEWERRPDGTQTLRDRAHDDGPNYEAEPETDEDHGSYVGDGSATVFPGPVYLSYAANYTYDQLAEMVGATREQIMATVGALLAMPRPEEIATISGALAAKVVAQHNRTPVLGILSPMANNPANLPTHGITTSVSPMANNPPELPTEPAPEPVSGPVDAHHWLLEERSDIGRLVIPEGNSVPRAESNHDAVSEFPTNGRAYPIYTFDAVTDVIVDWASQAFPARSIDTVRYKLIQEAQELILALAVSKWDGIEDEIADVQILIHDLCALRGISLPGATLRKLAVNVNRNWEIDANGLSHHVD